MLVKPDDPRHIQFVDFRGRRTRSARRREARRGQGPRGRHPRRSSRSFRTRPRKVLTLGFGQAAEIADEKDLRMHAPKFHRRGRLPDRQGGGSTTEGRQRALLRPERGQAREAHARDDSNTFYEGGAIDFNFSKETKLVGAYRCKQWDLGPRLCWASRRTSSPRTWPVPAARA